MPDGWDVAMDLDALIPVWGQIIAPDVEQAIRETIPVNTGGTAGSIEADPTEGGVDVTGNKVAGYLETGTPAHPIEGRPWLFWPGAEHPVHLVHHPGTGPDPYIENAVDAGQDQWADAMGTLIDQQWSTQQ